jgi:gamma-glutamyltranspeptidase/glutathione hydrolase
MSNGGLVSLETGFDFAVVRDLVERGHTVQLDMGSFGGYQAIMKHPEYGVYFGASESRKDGQAAGY